MKKVSRFFSRFNRLSTDAVMLSCKELTGLFALNLTFHRGFLPILPSWGLAFFINPYGSISGAISASASELQL